MVSTRHFCDDGVVRRLADGIGNPGWRHRETEACFAKPHILDLDSRNDSRQVKPLSILCVHCESSNYILPPTRSIADSRAGSNSSTGRKDSAAATSEMVLSVRFLPPPKT